MILKWFKRKENSSKKGQPIVAPNSPSPRKSKSSKGNKKPVKNKVPAWKIDQFVVEKIDGKTRFHDLNIHLNVLRAIQASGYEYCTPIQAKTLPSTLKGLDLIGKGQTGTGKTAAFLITIIDQLLCHPLKEQDYLAEPRALIIAPTRELVKQIEADARDLCQFTQLSIVSLVGGEKYDKQLNQLEKKSVDIVVATPGRLIDFTQRKALFLDQVEILVLDEADRMLDMGFIPQVKQIVRQTPPKEDRQTLLFSATFTQDIVNLSSRWTLSPISIDVAPEKVATETVEQISYLVSDHEKVATLAKLVQSEAVKRAIIFTNRKDQSQRLYDNLTRLGIKVGILTGDIQQNKRTQTLSAFKTGKTRLLIATDVVGRGIHIDGITHVFNYNLPQEPENYIHRIGRTGRAGASGKAINLIGEEDVYDLPSLEKLLGYKLELLTLPT